MSSTETVGPYRSDYEPGVGVDCLSGDPRAVVVAGDVSTISYPSALPTHWSVGQISGNDELLGGLGMDGAYLGSGLFGPHVSARLAFAQRCAVQGESLFLRIVPLTTADSSAITLSHVSISNPRLAPAAAKEAGDALAFERQYGNWFVQALDCGGLFCGILQFDTQGNDEKYALANSLSGTYDAFTPDVVAKFADATGRDQVSMVASMYYEGGPAGLQIADPTSPAQLFDNASKWLAAFTDHPDGNSVPYTVYLQPATGAGAPPAPDAAALDTASGVIMRCALERCWTLDQLNLLKYIVANLSSYDWRGGPPLGVSVLKDALSGYHNDLHMLEGCAAHAVSQPADAKSPAAFAAGLGKTYPSASIFPLEYFDGLTAPDIDTVRKELAAGTAVDDVDSETFEPGQVQCLARLHNISYDPPDVLTNPPTAPDDDYIGVVGQTPPAFSLVSPDTPVTLRFGSLPAAGDA